VNVDWMLDAVRSLRDRPSKAEWAMIQALAASTRGECTRRRVGAVVIDRRGRLAGAGYNGSEPGGPSCLKGECPRALSGVLPGSSYDTGPGACEAVHAELNAVLDVSDANRLEGARLFVTAEPCDGCLKILRTKPLREIVYLDETGVTWSMSYPFRR
jgi:dCMP deaminase